MPEQSEVKGYCKHGEFDLSQGCLKCIDERLGISPARQLVKVRYFSETTGELSPREYTYFSADILKVDDIVLVPVGREGNKVLSTAKARVSAIDVNESEIVAFRDKVKTIPSSAKIENAGVPNRSVPNETETVIRVDPGACLAPALATIKVKPEDDSRVLQLAAEAVRLRDYAVARTIIADVDLKPATEDLSIIAKVKKALTDAKVDYIKPIKGHLDDVNAAFAKIMTPLEEADKITRDKVLGYRATVAKRQAEADAINQQKIDLARREAQFNGTGEITVDTTPIESPAPVKRVSTDMGTAGVTRITTWELADFALVPDQYKVLDAGKITKIVKAGGSIPGIKIMQTEGLRVTTK